MNQAKKQGEEIVYSNRSWRKSLLKQIRNRSNDDGAWNQKLDPDAWKSDKIKDG
jgi:hypothetical protein